MKIKEFSVVKAEHVMGGTFRDDPTDDFCLVYKINQKIAEGWQPFGPIIRGKTGYIHHMQAMVRYEEGSQPDEIAGFRNIRV